MKRRSYYRWDGETKNKTKNCNKCPLKVDFWDKEICAWGVIFKYVVGTENLRKCEYFGKEPPKNNSLDYVLNAKKNNLFGSGKYQGQDATQLQIDFN